MLDLTTEFGSHAAQRLMREKIVWLTTVGADGTPQPNPVWFYWDGETFLIYSKPSAVKVKNIARNPRVALNFEGAAELGGDVVVFAGEARLEAGPPEPDPRYVEKYRVAAEALGWTWEALLADYSVTIRVRPSKVRGV